MNTIVMIAIMMILGMLSTRLMKVLKLPNVTGYLIVGLIIGILVNPATSFLPKEFLDNLGMKETIDGLGIISDVALGFIAYSIGVEFKLSHIKELGKNIVIITFFQAVTTTILVDLALIIIGTPLPTALCLGAIATATAPAATLMVVRQYKARGPLVNTLLPVVAFDDAIGLMIFAVSLSIAKVLSDDSAAITFQAIALEPLCEILFSLVIGFVVGLILALSMKFFKSRASRLSLMISAVLLCTGLSLNKFDFFGAFHFQLSSLLTCMMVGAAFVNFREDATKIIEGTERWTPPLFMMFFVLSGAELDITLIASAGIIFIVYVVVRCIGKYFGAFLGGVVAKSDKATRNYLGLTLFPQAGVAIGMAGIVANELAGDVGNRIKAVVLCATLVYELFGPVITKIALNKAGEIPTPEQLEAEQHMKDLALDHSHAQEKSSGLTDRQFTPNSNK